MNGRRILLVDEEDKILDRYSFLLSKEGYHAVTTNSGSKAIEQLHKQPFDIVITDLAMRNKNGQTILEEIREMLPLIPVIVLTDKISNIIRHFASLLGACALIKKPCSYKVLISSIRKSFLVEDSNSYLDKRK
ncbi:MAG: response regulator [Candidatus Woesearchaeota archaeon]|nr:MAG: response regulator [Candidatus Woesearchaeota archaeon]